jgi:hypothetical protein
MAYRSFFRRELHLDTTSYQAPVVPMTTTSNPEPGPIADRFPIFKVTRCGRPVRDKWGIACATCARAGVLWFRCCASPQEAASVMESHSWPCPSEEPAEVVDPATTKAILDAGFFQTPQWIIERYGQRSS